MRTIWIFASVVLSLVMTVGCTRSDSNHSKLSFNIPLQTKATAQSGTRILYHAVVNITAADLEKPILIERTGAGISSSFELEVPTGKDRLVQVFALYKDATTGEGSPYYTEAKYEISKSVVDLSLQLTDLFAGIEEADGAIAGRILDTANAGPTGEILIQYQPPSGAPALTIERASIANGWFNVFALRGLSLRYTMAETGRDLFGGPVDLRTAFTAVSAARAKIYIPPHTRLDGGGQRSEDAPSIYVIGYFGAGAGSQKVCGLTNAAQVADIYRYQQMATVANKLTFLSTFGAGTAVEPANLFSKSPAMTQITVFGGQDMSSGDCAAMTMTASARNLNQYSNYLPLYSESFSSGKDGIAGFQSPFAKVRTTDGAKEYDMVGAQLLHFDFAAGLKISGRLLPGMNSVIDTLKAYKVPASFDMEDMEHAPCLDFSQGKVSGVADVANTNVPADGRFDLQTPITAAELSAGVSSAICFVGGGKVHPHGVIIHSDWFPNSNPPGAMHLTARIESADDSSRGMNGGVHFSKNVCHDLKVRFFENGFSKALPSAVTLTGLPSSGGLTFYAGVGCTGPISSITAPTGVAEVPLFAMATAESVAGFFFPVSVTGGFTYSQNPMTAGLSRLQVTAPQTTFSDLCYPVVLNQLYANGTMRTLGVTTYSFKVGGVATSIYSSEVECHNSVNPKIQQIYGSLDNFWVKAPTGPTGVSVTAEIVDYLSNTSIVNVAAVGEESVAVYIKPIVSGMTAGVCSPIRFAVVNKNGVEIATKTTFEIAPFMNGVGGGLYHDSECEHSAAMPLWIPQMQSSTPTYYYKPTNMGTLNVFGSSPLPFDVNGAPMASPHASGNYLSYSLPAVTSPVMSAAEFGAEQPMNIQHPMSGQLFCEVEQGLNWSACPAGTITTTAGISTFHWSLQAAENLWKFRFRSEYNGSSLKVMFDPRAVLGERFRVLHCDVLLSGPINSSGVSSMLATPVYRHICFDGTAALTCDATIYVPKGKALIGHSSKTGVNWAVATGGACLHLQPTGAISDTTLVANLDLTVQPASAPAADPQAIFIDAGTSPYNSVELIQNRFSLRAYGSELMAGVYVGANSADTNIVIDGSQFVLDSMNNSVVGVVLSNLQQGPVHFANNSVTTVNPVYDSILFKYFRHAGPDPISSVHVAANSVNGQKTLLLRTITDAGSVGRMANFQFVNNTISAMGQPSEANIQFAGPTVQSHRLIGNKISFEHAPSGSFISVQPMGGVMNVEVASNTVVHRTYGHFLSSSGTGGTTFLGLAQNSFRSTSALSMSSANITSMADNAMLMVDPLSGIDNTGGNRVCSDLSGWSLSPVLRTGGSFLSPSPMTNFTGFLSDLCY